MGIISWLKRKKEPKFYPIELTPENFADLVEKSEKPLLINIWGPSCPWCRKLAPTIVNLAARYGGRINVAHLNAAAYPQLVEKFGSRGTPTVIFLKSGRVVEIITGFRFQSYYEEAIVTLFPEIFKTEK